MNLFTLLKWGQWQACFLPPRRQWQCVAKPADAAHPEGPLLVGQQSGPALGVAAPASVAVVVGAPVEAVGALGVAVDVLFVVAPVVAAVPAEPPAGAVQRSAGAAHGPSAVARQSAKHPWPPRPRLPWQSMPQRTRLRLQRTRLLRWS